MNKGSVFAHWCNSFDSTAIYFLSSSLLEVSCRCPKYMARGHYYFKRGFKSIQSSHSSCSFCTDKQVIFNVCSREPAQWTGEKQDKTKRCNNLLRFHMLSFSWRNSTTLDTMQKIPTRTMHNRVNGPSDASWRVFQIFWIIFRSKLGYLVMNDLRLTGTSLCDRSTNIATALRKIAQLSCQITRDMWLKFEQKQFNNVSSLAEKLEWMIGKYCRSKTRREEPL